MSTTSTTTLSVQDKPISQRVNRSGLLLERLKKAGYKVFVKHMRQTSMGEFSRKQKPAGAVIMPTGGSTYITIEDGVRQFKGEAHCHPYDNYDKNLGRFKALGRALHQMKFSSPETHEKISRILNSN